MCHSPAAIFQQPFPLVKIRVKCAALAMIIAQHFFLPLLADYFLASFLSISVGNAHQGQCKPVRVCSEGLTESLCRVHAKKKGNFEIFVFQIAAILDVFLVRLKLKLQFVDLGLFSPTDEYISAVASEYMCGIQI